MKTHQMFSVHATPEEVNKAILTNHFRFVFTVLLSITCYLSSQGNNMWTLKFKAQPTNAFSASVNQMFGGSSQLPTTAEHCLSVDLWILVMLLKCAVRKTQSEKSHAFRDAIIYEKAPFSKCFPSTLTRKAQRSTIALVWRAFSKSSWWISLDASPNPTNKDAASNNERNLHLLLFSITDFVIGLKISHHFHGQSKVKPKPVATRSYTFSSALYQFHVLVRVCLIHWIVSCDWSSDFL